MRPGGWTHKKLDIADNQVWLTSQCSDKFATGLLAMVGAKST
jgi:hypothetical protein